MELLQLEVTRVSAIDSRDLGDSSAASSLSTSERACYLSHEKALRLFLESDLSFAIIAEDDASLRKAQRIERVSQQIKSYGDALLSTRLECIQIGFLPSARRFISIGTLKSGLQHLRMLRTSSRLDKNLLKLRWGDLLAGAHAYMVTRTAAELILSSRNLDLPFDSNLIHIGQKWPQTFARVSSPLLVQHSRDWRGAKDSDISLLERNAR